VSEVKASMNEINSSNEIAAPDVHPRRASSARSTGWQRARFILRALEVRLRFIALFVGIGLLMAYWTTIEAHWDRWTRPAVAAAALDSDAEFYCPMHPSVVRTSLEPSGAVPNCPICGMPLSKRKKGEATPLPEGIVSRVQLSPERVRLAGVKTAEASYRPLVKEVRTVGYVQYDEARLAEIVTRVTGYIEKLYVDKTFIQVKKGEPLAEIYSPELYSSMQELLLAKRHGTTDLVASARERLKLLAVDDDEIDAAIKTNNAGARLLIRSPQTGQVIEKNIVQGASVQPQAVLFKVADLSTVWIEADVYERDLPFLREGQQIEASVEAFSNKTFQGNVALIYPELNPETRTNRVRISVDNPKLLLRPGMFATVLVKTPIDETEPFKSQLAKARQAPTDDAGLVAFQKFCPVTGKRLGSMGDPLKVSINNRTVFLCCAGCESTFKEHPEKYLAKLASPPEEEVLSVPEQAVIDTGTQQIVYVEREPGVFEGVKVELGPRTGQYYPVISGLAVGDKVAAAGSFLLDAETRLNPAAGAAYFGSSGSPPGDSSSGVRESTTSTTKPLPRQEAALSADQLKQIEKLPPGDRQAAMAQRICPVSGGALGSMGVPMKVTLKGRSVFLCCPACVEKAKEHPEEILEKTLKSSSTFPHENDSSIEKRVPAATGHRH
jgi:Cu(I)/Ag(I) efflux system membrane fusion protein